MLLSWWHCLTLSDTVTSVFHIAIKDTRCSSADIVWSDVFGLGWRFGIAYNPHEWFAKVRLYLDHNHACADQDRASVTVALRDSPNTNTKGHKERVTEITEFGHGQPVLLGSWSPNDLVSYPHVALTLTTRARIPEVATDPLASMTMALRQSMDTGDFVDTKFYLFSAKRPGTTAGIPRTLYVNNGSVGLVLPKPTLGAKQAHGLAPTFMVNMTSDHHINRDSVLHEYEYEQDSDLDEEDDTDTDAELEPNTVPGEFQTGSSSKPHTSSSTQGGSEDDLLAEPPAYSVSNCRMVLVKGIAYKTWAAYIYFRYTGQVSFLPLKSAQGSPARRSGDPTQPPSCSPKSMYRLAVKLEDERMKDLAFRAIKEGLSKYNIVEETFSWFTAQYPAITEYEVDQVSDHRRSREVSTALKLQVKAVSHGEKPWATGVLVAIMDKLNPSDPSP